MEELRLDELAARAGVPSTTVRLYRTRGLLPPPRLEGRTGWYDDTHLARLRLIGRLQDDGFSLAGIGRLLATWEQGRDLQDLVGVEQQLDALLAGPEPVVVDAAELAGRLSSVAVTPELVRRAVELGLVELLEDGRFRVPDPRFLETGQALAQLGVPAEAILDEWGHLVEQTDVIAGRFLDLFERHLLPERQDDLPELAATLARLRSLAGQVVGAALDASIASGGRERLGELSPR